MPDESLGDTEWHRRGGMVRIRHIPKLCPEQSSVKAEGFRVTVRTCSLALSRCSQPSHSLQAAQCPEGCWQVPRCSVPSGAAA